jgi:site-specific DNA recombinase
MKAAVYTRVSSAELQLDGYSLEAQRSACQRLAGDRGWEVVNVYTDPGVSARTMERAQFQAMMRDAQAHRFDVVIVHKLDRFSRSVVDLLTALHDLEEAAVTLVSATEQFDFSTPMGQVMLTMLAAFAQWYLDNLSAETAKGKRARAEAGLWNGAVPFGYSVTYKKDGGDGMAHPEEGEAEGVRLAFREYSTGLYSDADIARILNEAGHRPNGRGRRALALFSKDTVTEMLRNRFYLGEVQYKGDWFEGFHEPIVGEDLFNSVQDVRRRRRSAVGVSARKGSREYPLSGLARCARCGWPMRGASASGRRYYRDPARDQGRECDQRMVSADEAEEALGAFMQRLTLPSDWRNRVLKLIQDRAGQRVEIAREKARIERQLDRLKRLFVLGDMQEQEYLGERARLEAKAAALVPPAMPDLERAAELLSTFGAI